MAKTKKRPTPPRGRGPQKRAPEPAARRLPLWAYAALGALVVAAVLVGASMLGGDDEAGPDPAAVDTGATVALLDGIPQSGNALGDPDAPLTLVEYADLQCPFCAEWSERSFGRIVEDYVRPGRLRLVFNGMAFIGPDSERALRVAEAAGEQDRMWHVVHLLFEHQGGENSGWASDELFRAIGDGVPGLDTAQMLERRSSAEVGAQLEERRQAAQEAGIQGTPSFQLGPTGGTLDRLELQTLDPEELAEIIDARLAG